MTETQGLILAFGFGVFYNWLITRWGKSEYGEGFTALWVAIGFLVTLAISASVTQLTLTRLHIDWIGNELVLSNAQHAAWYELKFFIASGIPMFVGSLWRYINNIDMHLNLL